MELDAQELFEKIKTAEIKYHPFAHLIVDNFLPCVFYKQLASQLEQQDFPTNYIRGSYGNRERYAVDLTDYSTWKSSGKNISTTLHLKNYESLCSDNGSIIQAFVDTLLKNEVEFYSLLGAKMPTERMRGDYFFHINMTKDDVGYTIGPHLDDRENIFTILFYTPETDVNKEFGLNVCQEKIDFIPNRMVIFPPSGPDERRPPTWHEVKRLTDKLVGTRNSFQMFFLQNNI